MKTRSGAQREQSRAVAAGAAAGGAGGGAGGAGVARLVADAAGDGRRALRDDRRVARGERRAMTCDQSTTRSTSFLERFPDDPRAAEVQAYADELELQQLERQLRCRRG